MAPAHGGTLHSHCGGARIPGQFVSCHFLLLVYVIRGHAVLLMVLVLLGPRPNWPMTYCLRPTHLRDKELSSMCLV